MKGGLSCVALAFGLLTETLFALGQTTSPTSVAQGPSSPPPSGVLATPPPAPVLVPPSGVLPTLERHAVAGRPLKMAQQIHIAKTYASASMRRHTVSSRPASRRHTITRHITVAQSMAPTLTVVSAAAEEPRHDETFLSQLGKVKRRPQRLRYKIEFRSALVYLRAALETGATTKKRINQIDFNEGIAAQIAHGAGGGNISKHDSLIVPYFERSFGRQIRLAVRCNSGDVTEPQTLDHLPHFVS